MQVNRSKSVAFLEDIIQSDKEDVGNSPLKLHRQNSKNVSIITPKKPGNRSTSKTHLIGGMNEDCENDASLACSSGKNSRRKTSLLSRNA